MAKITVKSVSPECICKLADVYLANRYCTFESMANSKLSSHMISNLLFRGIAEDILNDSVANMVFDKVVSYPEKGKFQRIKRWEVAFDQRSEKRQSERKVRKLAETRAEMAMLEHQIASYDECFANETDAPSKEELMARLNELRAAC